MSGDLPKGWNKARIADIATTQSGGTPSTGKKEYWDNGTIPWINSGALRDEVISAPSTLITRLGLENSSAKLFPKNTVVIALTGATTGRVGLLGLETSTNQSVTGIFPSTFFVPEYLFYYLRSERKFVIEQAIGSAQPHINKQIVDDLEVPLAPLAEQKRIVAKVEKLLAKVDASRARLERVSALLKRFRQSVLAAACSGRLTADWRGDKESGNTDKQEEHPDGFPDLPRAWRWAGLEETCETIVDCPHSTPKWTGSGRLCVRTTNFKPGLLDLSEVRYVSNATFNERIERLRPEAGDILYSREGGILGLACMIPPEVELCLGQRMMLLRAKKNFAATFLMHWLNCPLILRRVRELTGGSAAPHLNVKDIKCFPTPVPPTPEQQEIVRRVEELFALADRLEARVGKARGQVDKLTQSILAKAFRGELVPQDPNDEPAEKLLARIRAATGPVAVQGGKVASSVSVRRGRPRKVR